MRARRYHRLCQVLDTRQPDLTVVMENIQKSHNLSAILRSCDAVGILEAHTVQSEGQVPTFNATAKGSEKWVQVRSHVSTLAAIEHLKTEGFQIYSAHLSPAARDFREVDYVKPTAILVGTEWWGTSETAATLSEHIVIPMMGMVESLNVSVATAVILFEAQRQRLAAGLYDRPRLDPDLYEKTLFEWAYPKVARGYRERGEPYPMEELLRLEKG